MNKQIFLFGLILLAVVWLLRPSAGSAQTGNPSFASVIPFSTPAGNFGMFDQRTGTIYIYDSGLSKCIFIGKMAELGEPVVRQEQ